MAFSIEVKDYATGQLKEIREGLSSEAVRKVVGASIAKKIINHFQSLSPNKLGGKRHFWEGAAKSTTMEVTSDGGKVSVTQLGVRQRLLGGTLKPGTRTPGAKFLTIPARSEAYGRRARDISGLQILWGLRGGKPTPVALVAGKEGAARVTSKGKRQKLLLNGKAGQGQRGLVFYWLVKQVTQQGDRNTLPSDQELDETAKQSASSYVEHLISMARNKAAQ